MQAMKLVIFALFSLGLLLVSTQSSLAQGTIEFKAKADQFCVVHIDPLETGKTESNIWGFQCFNSQKAADSYTEATTSVIIAEDFSGANYTGSRLQWIASTGCSILKSYAFKSMPNGWDNVVSSSKAFSGCNKNRLYEYQNYGGATQLCSPNCASLGAMDNKTSSRKLSWW